MSIILEFRDFVADLYNFIKYLVQISQEALKIAGVILIGLAISIAIAVPFTDKLLGPFLVLKITVSENEQILEKMIQTHQHQVVYYNHLIGRHYSVKHALEINEEEINVAITDFEDIKNHHFFQLDHVKDEELPEFYKLIFHIPLRQEYIQTELLKLYRNNLPEIKNGQIVIAPKVKAFTITETDN